MGFAEGAFAPFLNLLTDAGVRPELPRPGYFELLGIVPDADGSGWRQYFTLKPGDDYQAAALYERLVQAGTGRLFDPVFFAERLGRFLAHTFQKMLLMVGASAVVLLGLFFWDLTLSGLALLPLAGAFAGTLGVLGLLGRPLDIPALMLGIIVLGMGIDYALFTIRAFQRYGRETDPALALFRTTVFLAAGSTLVGFGALISAEHAVFRSAGVTSFCGIFFSALGAFILLPPPLRRLFRPLPARGGAPPGSPPAVRKAARRRFRHLELAPRWSAWRKLRAGGLVDGFPLTGPVPKAAAIYPADWGVEAAWLAEALPGLRLQGADPDPEKVRVAERVAGPGAEIRQGGFTALSDDDPAGPVDLVLLTGRSASDEDPHAILQAAHGRLACGGRLQVLAATEARSALGQSGWLRRLYPGPLPYEAHETEALLRRMGDGPVERHRIGEGAALVWLSAVKR
jgi:hypothetical protein